MERHDGVNAAAPASHGRRSVEAFIDDALYGPGGFYQTVGRAGRRGDFITSAEVGPLFGAVVARYLDAEWTRLGHPDDFTVVDAGAGPGTLARSIRAADPACLAAIDYVAVEIGAAQREQHPDWVRSTPRMPSSVSNGVVIANELLDNLAFRLAVFDGGWREAFADVDRGRVVEVLGSVIEPRPTILPATAPHGARAPLQDRAAAWVSDTLGILSAGSVVAFDYGVARTAELVLRPWRDWLRTYRGHERGDHYLASAGHQDITVDVCFDQLPEPTAVRSQSQWLALYGIHELVDEGRTFWEQHAAAPDLEAIRMRSRITEAQALLDPAGLGGFWAVEWTV